MNQHPLDVIERFSSLRALVVGEAMLDRYIEGTASRLSREAPAPVVQQEATSDAPGGAANTAANVRALGAEVNFVSAVGDDEDGSRVVAALVARGISPDDVIRVPGRRTLAKRRIVADGQMLVRVDSGDSTPLDDVAAGRMIERIRHRFTEADAVVVSDYGYGTLTQRAIAAIGRLQSATPRVLVVDARDYSLYRAIGATAVKPNYDEARRMLARDPLTRGTAARPEAILAHGRQLLRRTGAEIVAVTLDHDGAVVLSRDGASHRTYATPATGRRTTGAGDTFGAALALALAAGAEVHAAAEIASAASAVAVARDGTTTCAMDELRAAFSAGDKFVRSIESLRTILRAHRRNGHRIVFTNGCFDIVHRGHVGYLNQAKALGDLLIVGLNDDDSVRRLKGEDRPLNALEDRAQVLAALSCVDLVVPFAEDTPVELIRVIAPDVMAKGGDYTRESLPEAPLVEALGGEVRILPYLDGRSTSEVIQRIRRSHAIAEAVAP